MAFGGGEVGDVFQQGGMAVGADFGIAEFPGLAGGFGGHHGAAQLLGHGLHAVADAQHGDAQFEHHLGGPGSVALGYGTGAAGEDDALGAVVADELFRHVVGVDFAENLGLPHPAGDELGDLGTEVENEDFLVGHDGSAMWAIGAMKPML